MEAAANRRLGNVLPAFGNRAGSVTFAPESDVPPGQDILAVEASSRRTVVKEIDGPFAAHVIGPISYRLVLRLQETRVTPDQVTWMSFALILLAASVASMGTLAGNVCTVALIQLSFLLDMVDGQLARARRSASAFGAYLDYITDRLGEAGLYLGVAFGFARMDGTPGIWALAYGAMVVIMLRYMSDLVLDARQSEALDDRGWLTRRLEGLGIAEARQRSGLVGILKGTLWFGSGERYLLLSVSLLFLRPDLYFAGLLLIAGPSYATRAIQRLRRLTRSPDHSPSEQ